MRHGAAVPPPPELQQLKAASAAAEPAGAAPEFKVPAPQPKAQYIVGQKLVLAAPAHTGLPNGATAIVASVLPFDAAAGAWSYAVTLTGGGPNGSGVQFIKSVREGWLRTEGRIATAKACAPMAFGAFARLAPRIIVPLFQRRYCWGEPQWRQLWRDIVSPRHSVSAVNPHAIGRVVVARESGGVGSSGRAAAVVLVDGQQRTTTLMLLLCAMRDVARGLDADAAAPLTTAIDRVLTSRSAASKLQHGARACAPRGDTDGPHELVSKTIEQAKVGLEGLDGAQAVRLVPSRDDRLPFCSLVLSAPFERAASGGARTMAGCYDFFTARVQQHLSESCFDVAMSDAIGADGAEAWAAAVRDEAAAGMGAARTHALLSRLTQLLEFVLTRLSLVVFELQDGVALQNMYDMLAQRERAIAASGFFSHIGGKAMAQADLVRNLLLGHLADEDERVQAYEEYWRPMERAQGEGDAIALDRFLEAFLRAELPAADREMHAALFDEPRAPPGTPGASMLDGFGALVRAKGGTSGAVSLHALGTDAASAQVVDSAAAKRAVLDLLGQLRASATAAGAPTAATSVAGSTSPMEMSSFSSRAMAASAAAPRRSDALVEGAEGAEGG